MYIFSDWEKRWIKIMRHRSLEWSMAFASFVITNSWSRDFRGFPLFRNRMMHCSAMLYINLKRRMRCNFCIQYCHLPVLSVHCDIAETSRTCTVIKKKKKSFCLYTAVSFHRRDYNSPYLYLKLRNWLYHFEFSAPGRRLYSTRQEHLLASVCRVSRGDTSKRFSIKYLPSTPACRKTVLRCNIKLKMCNKYNFETRDRLLEFWFYGGLHRVLFETDSSNACVIRQ